MDVRAPTASAWRRLAPTIQPTERAGCRGASDLDGIDGGGVDDVRGQRYELTLPGGAGSRSWCAGTYRVSVALYDLGLAGGLKHPDRQFHTGAFAVRP